MIYLIGSLRNPKIVDIGNQLRAEGFEVFDDWYAGGEIADDSWRDYEKARGRTYAEALNCPAAKHVFEFDLKWLNAADTAVLVLPAGKSSHLELGWMLGQGKRGFILLDNPDRWDVMVLFATGVCDSVEGLITLLKAPYVKKPGFPPRLAREHYDIRNVVDYCLTCGGSLTHERCR